MAGTKATVWLMPTGLNSSIPCDSALDWDLGCNAWWLRSDGWSTFEANIGQDAELLKYNLPSENATVIVYFPLWVADPMHAGLGLARLDTVLRNLTSAGLRVTLFLGRPEFYGMGTQSGDIIHDAAARYRFEGYLNSTLDVPAVQAYVRWISVYWMSAFCLGRGPSFCSQSDIAVFNQRIQSLVHAGQVSYLQHVDGPFWEGCWPQPCNSSAWVVGGYSSTSLANLDALLGESWVQGSLVGAVQTLWSTGAFSARNTLLVNDVPNCDLFPASHPCSSGSLSSDDSEWFDKLNTLGLKGQWAVWDGVDGGTEDPNYYGDIMNNGAGLTAKGALHRQAVQASDEACP